MWSAENPVAKPPWVLSWDLMMSFLESCGRDFFGLKHTLPFLGLDEECKYLPALLRSRHLSIRQENVPLIQLNGVLTL